MSINSEVQYNADLFAENTGWRWPLLLTVAALCVVLLAYAQTVVSMVDIWWRSETFAHGFLILPISLWLIWRHRQHLQNLQPVMARSGLFGLFAMGLIWLLAHYVDVTVIQQLSLVSTLILLVWTLLGTAVVWGMAFPLMFLFFAVPIGEGLIPPLMDFTADFTVKMVELTGIPVYREGTFFELPTGHWSVVEGCSGVRYLIASITLGCLYAYLTYTSYLKRSIFILAAIFVPIIANGLRAYMIVMIAHYSDMTLALGVDHLIYGWLFFGLVIMLMFFVGSFWRDDEPAVVATSPPMPKAQLYRESSSGPNKSYTILVVLAVSLTVIWPGIAALQKNDSEVVAGLVLATPVVPTWAMAQSPLSTWQPQYLGTDAELSQDYVSDDEAVSLFLGYYAKQRQGAELINSQNVLVPQKHPVWRMPNQQNSEIEVNGKKIKVIEATVQSATQKLFVIYWYWLAGTYTNNHTIAKLLEAKVRLTGSTASSSVVMLTAEYDENTDQAKQQILKFLATGLHEIDVSLVNVTVKQTSGSD